MAFAAWQPVHAGDFYVPGVDLSPRFSSVKSIQQNRFSRVVKQQFDYSCGSGSLATLLTYHYERPADELTAIRQMIKVGDEKKIQKEGFSLLDMKMYLQSIGFQAEGYKAPLAKLEQVGIPAIALLNIQNYMHFVVVKGIRGDDILLGDPTLGTRIMKRADFEKSWNGILFVIMSHRDIGRKHFNDPEDWKIINKSPLYAFQGQSLTSFTIHTSLTPNYY